MEVRPEPQWEQEVTAFAAGELSHGLERLLPLGTEALPVILEASPEPLRFDGFRIRCGKDEICIQASCARGILHGSYELLRRLGCSFLFP